MSTKTTIKRVALVAAASLALGGFSAVSARAADTAGATSVVTAIALKTVTSSPASGSAVAVNVGLTSAAAAGSTTADLVGVLTAYPAGGYVGVTAVTTLGAGSNGVSTGNSATAATAAGATLTIGGTRSGASSAFLAGSTAVSATAGAGSFSFTPTKAGTYTLTIWHDAIGGTAGAVDPLEARQTVDIVVAAATAWSPSLSTIYAATAGSTATSSTVTTGWSKSAPSGVGVLAANGLVTLLGSSGAAYYGQTVTASVSGPGLIHVTAGGVDTTVGTVRAISTVLSASQNTIGISLASDGNSGASTVTVSVTDNVSGATTSLGSFGLTFYGSVAKLTATSVYSIAPSGGGYLGVTVGSTAPIANRVASTDVPAAIIKATDSSGQPVGGLTIKVVSSDTTIANSATSGYCVADVLSTANVYSSGGTGYYNCMVVTPGTAASGKSATITYEVLDPADPLGVAYLTATQAITTGGAIATETAALDNTSYSAGGAMVLTVAAKDKYGNPAYDGQTALGGSVAGNKALGGTMPGTTKVIVGGKYATSATTPSIFAPAVGGDFTVLVPLNDTDGTTATVNAAVSDDAASAASSLALDAANAATDAANNAYDEAQNATQAASDALAAVTALAAQVKSLIASVKKLTTAVAKLKK